MLSNVTQVDATPREDHAMYLNNWIKCLKDNPKAISKAASLAEKAVKFVTNAAAPASVEVAA
jgi:antirestriction protein ArdC